MRLGLALRCVLPGLGAPAYPDLDVDNALVIFNDRGTNLTERIGGVTWAGQSRSYTIYPQRSGFYEIVVANALMEWLYRDGRSAHGPRWSASELVNAVSRARRQRRAPPATPGGEGVVVPLNPTAGVAPGRAPIR